MNAAQRKGSGSSTAALHIARKDQLMELIPTLLKYIFVAAVAVEGILIVRAIITLAKEKAQAAAAPAASAEE